MEEIGREALLKLIEFIESASPQLWEIATRQVAVDLTRYWVLLGVSAFFFLLALFLAVWAIYEEIEEAGFASVFLFLIFAPTLLVSIMGVIGRTMNPEYYAIKVLIELLK